MSTTAPHSNHKNLTNISGRIRKYQSKQQTPNHPSTGGKKAKHGTHKGEVKSNEEDNCQLVEAPEQHEVANATLALLMAHFFSSKDGDVCVLTRQQLIHRRSRASSSSSTTSSSSTAWRPGRRLNRHGYTTLVERLKQADRFLPDSSHHPAAFHYNINSIHTGDLSNASITFPRSRWCKRKDDAGTWVLLLNYPYPNPCKTMDDIRNTPPPRTVFAGANNENLNAADGLVQRTLKILPHPIPKFYCSMYEQVTVLRLLYENSTDTSYTVMVRLLRASPTAAYQPCIFPLLLHILNRGSGTGRTQNEDFSTGMSALDAKFVLLLVLYSPLDVKWSKNIHTKNNKVKVLPIDWTYLCPIDWTYFEGKTTSQLLREVVRVNPEYETLFGEFLTVE